MVDQTFIIKKLQSKEEVFVIFSHPTNMPFVECDPETFDDQVYILTDEKSVQEFAKEYTDKKILLKAVKITQSQLAGMYNSFYAIGANAIVFHDGSSVSRIQLESISKKPDINKAMQEKMPIVNPTLQLSTLYFLEELYRPIDHDKVHLKELEEEMIANLYRSRFILPLENAEEGKAWKPDDPNQKTRIPFVKDKQGNLLLAVFSDFAEFRKFYKQNTERMGMAVLTFEDLPKHLVKDAFGVVVNPGGFHLQMTREQLHRILGIPEAK